MVLPNLAPQLPSVVGMPVGDGCALTTLEGLPRTGSPEVVADGGRVAADVGMGTWLMGALSLQPFWHPLPTRQ
jgi:hypothetical protein